MSFFKYFFSSLKPERFFFVCAAVFGFIFIAVTPPFQTPDEFNHFYRAYQISEGHFVAINQDHRVGGYMPVSLVNSSRPFRFLLRAKYESTSWAVIKKQLSVELNPEEKIFVDFPNTGMYAFVSYLPQATGIFILRILQLPPIYIFYGGRIAALLFWLFSISFIIRWLPFYKWLFTLLALLPMSVSTDASMSADVMTNVLAFGVIAYSFHLAYVQPIVSARHMIGFIVLAFLLALAKVVYLPVILLVFLIPQAKFSSKRAYYSRVLLLFVVSGSTALYWSSVMKGLYVPYKLYNSVAMQDIMLWTSMIPCANMPDQIQYIMTQDIWHVPFVFYNSFIEAFDLYSKSYIGTFGWLDTDLPLLIIYAVYGCIFLVAIWDGDQTIVVGRKFKPLLIASFTITLTLILLSQLLTWVCVGGDTIYTIQGRYLIPIMPLLFMLLRNQRWIRKDWTVYSVVFFSVFALSYSSYVLYERYFVLKNYETVTFHCNAENISDHHFLTDTDSVLLDNADTRSNEKPRSGKYAAKVSLKTPYTFTYHLFNCKRGDSIKVDAYRWGKSGGIIISDTEDKFHTFAKGAIDTDSSGWEHVQAKLVVPEDMQGKEIRLFGYYPEGNDSSYFDDIKIIYRKLK